MEIQNQDEGWRIRGKIDKRDHSKKCEDFKLDLIKILHKRTGASVHHVGP